MKPVQLIALFAENKLGQMSRITQLLADEGVNIRWVTFATSERFGVIKLLVDQTGVAFRALEKQGWTVSLVEVLAVEVQDKPGGLHAIIDCLTRNGINVENSSGFVANNRAVVLIEVKDVTAARKILAREKLHQLSQEEMLKL
ncbi:MAG TPA: hypothetical protein VMC06_06685 [Opitutaceae bacterium]|nr:hypothetical protein [Opitutaceae bacterium]